ncbi:hypothetical protein B0A55_09742 [Friedmanniomyces simplex]|uniref:IgE-binding protein n=1 Tax=Friedmanniomyces simplex TaxID=329884 RepID=A0A4U0WRB3_9PEZI|nr:hypothetical protein B0A55_09742 [Friedmanniomyces simplex]
MKTAIALAALAGLISSAQAQFYGLTALHSGSPIHFLPVNAAGESLHLGGISTHYCPEDVQQEGGCPNTVMTNFMGGNGGLSMGALVPGGQMVYVDSKCGAVKYTQPHSAFIPVGASTDGFSFAQGPSFGTLSWGNGFVACNDTGDGTWSVYAILPNVTLPDAPRCFGFDAIATNETEPAAWEYT